MGTTGGASDGEVAIIGEGVTADDIRLRIDTSLSNATVESIIDKVYDGITAILAKKGLTVSIPTPTEITNAWECFTSARVLTRDWAGGTTPDTHKVGEFNQKSGIREQIAAFEAEGKQSITDYIHEQKKGNYPEIFEVIENKTDTNI